MMKERNSNIEMLRIISMLFIVISHYTVHNGVVNSTLPLGFNRIFLEIMTLGNIGSILFVLISGYYMVESDKLKINKIFNLWFQIFCYSILIYFCFVVFGSETFTIKGLLKSLLPITFEQYWFASAYILLYIFHPYINKMIKSLSRKEHLSLILIALSIFSVMRLITTQKYYGNELIQFFIFYIIGCYLGKYKKNIFNSNKVNGLIIAITTFILISSVIIFDLVGTKMPVFATHSTYLFSRTSIITILFSISLFSIFLNKEKFNNKGINLIASCTFAIYLISDNSLVRKFLWVDFFKNFNYVNSGFLVGHLVVSVLLVFIICIIIDIIRKNTLEKLYKKYISLQIDVAQKKFENEYNRIIKKISR